MNEETYTNLEGIQEQQTPPAVSKEKRVQDSEDEAEYSVHYIFPARDLQWNILELIATSCIDCIATVLLSRESLFLAAVINIYGHSTEKFLLPPSPERTELEEKLLKKMVHLGVHEFNVYDDDGKSVISYRVHASKALQSKIPCEEKEEENEKTL